MALAKTEKRSDLPDDYLPRKASLENLLGQAQSKPPVFTTSQPLHLSTPTPVRTRSKKFVLVATCVGTLIVLGIILILILR